MGYGLYASPGYLARRTPPVEPGDLVRHETLAFSGGNHQATWVLSHGQQVERVTVQPRLKANNVFAVRDAAVAGLGIAQLPVLVADTAVRAGQLRGVLTAWSPPTVPVHAVFASARYLTPKVRAFIDIASDAEL